MNTLRTLTLSAESIHPDTFLNPARLMSPDELRAALAGRGLQEGGFARERWMLCGDVREAAFDAMRERGGVIPCRLSVFHTPAGNGFSVITHQVAGHQHRFMLPLYDPVVRAFVEAAADGVPCDFSLARAGGADAMMFEGLHHRQAFVPLRPLCGPHGGAQDREQRRFDFAAALATLCGIDAIPGMEPGHVVSGVSISAVVPDEMREYADGAQGVHDLGGH